MITQDQARELIGRDVSTANGDRVGRIGQVFLDDETGQPEWVTVHTGLFGTSESFVPLADASVAETGLTVPYDKSRIKDAPNIDVETGHLSADTEAQLYEYYGLSYPSTDAQQIDSQQMDSQQSNSQQSKQSMAQQSSSGSLGSADDLDTSGLAESQFGRASTDRSTDHSSTTDTVSGQLPSSAMQSSQSQMDGTSRSSSTNSPDRQGESDAARRARLRRYVVTEGELGNDSSSGTSDPQR